MKFPFQWERYLQIEYDKPVKQAVQRYVEIIMLVFYVMMCSEKNLFVQMDPVIGSKGGKVHMKHSASKKLNG